MPASTPSRLAAFVDTWLELAAAMTSRDLSADSLPRSGLHRGAAGIAYVLGRIGRARADAAILAESRRWFQIARRTAARGGWKGDETMPPNRQSVMFGPIGLAAAAAIITPSGRAVSEYITVAKRGLARAPAEYMFGLAGGVFGALAVTRATGEPAAATFARDLATRLAKQAALPVGGFAHGDLGVVAARLAASTSAEPELIAALAAVEPTEVLGRGGGLTRSWCNGLAGYTLAWVLAAERAGDERCRDRALGVGQHLLEQLDEAGGSMCCGLAGRAYALLAIARIDPGGPWIEHAHAFGERAFGHVVEPAGMLQGFAGLVLLAHDLRTPTAARFPMLDL